MKTVTTREAQHHLSKVLEMVTKGEEVVITRRGECVAKLSQPDTNEAKTKAVDWTESVRRRNERLNDIPQMKRNIIVELREEERC